MPVVTDTGQAEEVARQWLKAKYGGKLSNIKFTEVMLEGDVWNIRLDGTLNRGLLDLSKRVIVVRVNADTTDVVGYSDNPKPKPE